MARRWPGRSRLRAFSLRLGRLYWPLRAAILLPAVVGPKNAAELLLTGNRIDANKGLRIGLVNRVVPSEELEAATDEMLTSLTSFLTLETGWPSAPIAWGLVTNSRRV